MIKKLVIIFAALTIITMLCSFSSGCGCSSADNQPSYLDEGFGSEVAM